MARNGALPETATRVAASSSTEANARIRRQTEANIFYFAHHRDRIDERLAELDREWDIERALTTNASALALAGVVLGAAVSRRFLLLPAVVAGFLLQHSLQGWCPPLPLMRRAGLRTASEIDRERYALKYLRGDFATRPGDGASQEDMARSALGAVERANGAAPA